MSAGPVFRRANPGEAAKIAQITRESYSKWIGLIGRKPLPMTFDYAQIMESRHVELSITDEEISGLIDFDARPGHFLIENLAVAPKHQGAGLGAALLGRCEALAVGNGCREIRLYTNRMFAENILFYAKRGYSCTHEEPFEGGVLVHMAKSLA